MSAGRPAARAASLALAAGLALSGPAAPAEAPGTHRDRLGPGLWAYSFDPGSVGMAMASSVTVGGLEAERTRSGLWRVERAPRWGAGRHRHTLWVTARGRGGAQFWRGWARFPLAR